MRTIKLQLINERARQSDSKQESDIGDDETSDNESTAEDQENATVHPECDQCHKKFSSNFALKLHQKQKHHSRQSTSQLGRFYSLTSLPNHQRQTPSKRLRSNEEITENDEPKNDLKKFKGAEKNTEYDQQSDTESDYSARTYSSKHRPENKSEETVICKHCNKQLSCKGSLSRHMKTVHNLKKVESILNLQKVGNKKFYCEECNRQFKNRRCYASHIRNSNVHQTEHDVKRTFECPYCGNFYMHESSLNRHVTEVHKQAIEDNKAKNSTRNSDDEESDVSVYQENNEKDDLLEDLISPSVLSNRI